MTRDVGVVTMDLNEHRNDQCRRPRRRRHHHGQRSHRDRYQPGQHRPGRNQRCTRCRSDTVVINGTEGSDAITISTNNGVVTVTGLAETVTISNFDSNDHLVINGLGGDDVIMATGLTGMQLIANGGDGDDVADRQRRRRHPAWRCRRRRPDRRSGSGRPRPGNRQRRRHPVPGRRSVRRRFAGPVHGVDLRHGRRSARARRRSPRRRQSRSRSWHSRTLEATSSPGERK